MRIVMIGTGYVGLVTGTCFAESGNEVICVDIDPTKVARLKQGDIPIYEPGLSSLVERNMRAGRLSFTTSAAECVPQAEAVFIAVGTPQADDGAADLRGLWKVVDTLAPLLDPETIVVVKSTVPVGTNRKVFERLKELTGRDCRICSNPEFLKEGCAIDDFTKPDRVVVGVLHADVGQKMNDLYKPFLRTEKPFLVMGLESAEMTKYVANCMLATKISFINEMANLCDKVGADVNDVRRGIGHDQRIGFQFLFPGVGYGGSCFPKDVRALMRVAEDHQLLTKILEAVDTVNDAQKQVLYGKLVQYFPAGLADKTIGVWGLSFKPRTDDIREAPSLVLIDALLADGAKVRVHDPVAQENVRAIYGDKLVYCERQYDAIDGADALCIVTEWNEFRNPNFATVKSLLKRPLILDGRNLYNPAQMKELGFQYEGIGLRSEHL